MSKLRDDTSKQVKLDLDKYRKRKKRMSKRDNNPEQ